jgi:uncharacterized membrane protein
MRGATQMMGRALVGALVLAWMATAGWSQTLTWLGTPIGNTSVATAVSDDGKIIAGRSGSLLAGPDEADVLLWNRRTNTVLQISTNGGAAWMMTPDGNKVVGYEGRAIRNYRAFIWTPNGKLYLPGYGAGAICINRAGTFAAGGVNYNVTVYPALWNANTQELVLTLSFPGEFLGVSDDGNTLLLLTARYGIRAEIWDRVHNTFRTLPPYQSDPYTLGFKLTPDGAIAVGTSGEISDIWLGVGLNYRAVMWRSSNNWQVEPLASLGGQRGIAYDIKGNTIVGFVSTPAGENRAVRWHLSTATTQVEDLNQTYSALLSPGSRLKIAFGASYNERFIVGVGYNAATGRDEAFLLDTRCASYNNGDVNCDGCVDDADLLAVLFAFGQNGSGLLEDVNSDGVVDDADLLQVLFNFGSGC